MAIIKATVLVLTLLSTFTVFSMPSLQTLFVSEYPSTYNRRLDSCATCHMPIVKDFLNGYGLALKQSKINFKRIEKLDSDNDGKPNIEEIMNFTFPGSQVNDDPENFIFTTATKGEIYFAHEMHVSADGYGIKGDCSKCHSPDMFPKKFDDTISVRSKAHAICWKCHKKSGSENAPKKCGDCHMTR